MHRLRIATYNVHKCQGLDRRVSPSRIAVVLRELDADVIALQEVVSVAGHAPEMNQSQYLAEALSYHCAMGSNRVLRGGSYGNVVLSRFPLAQTCNYDLSVAGREQRGCLRADVMWNEAKPLHVFNVHLGTSFLERRQQGSRLVSPDCLETNIVGPRVVLGDFNEWTHGLASQLLSQHLVSPDLRQQHRFGRSYPGLLPFLHLDHIYHDPALQLSRMWLHRSRTAFLASDHMPLVADFACPATVPE